MISQPVGGPWLRVQDVISIFVQMGCTLGEVPGGCDGPEGHEAVRYLFNPETEAFAPLSGLDDDDRISAYEVEALERRLGIVIPKGEGRSN